MTEEMRKAYENLLSREMPPSEDLISKIETIGHHSGLFSILLYNFINSPAHLPSWIKILSFYNC